MDRKEYDQMAEELKPGGHKVKNGFNAFLYGCLLYTSRKKRCIDSLL